MSDRSVSTWRGICIIPLFNWKQDLLHTVELIHKNEHNPCGRTIKLINISHSQWVERAHFIHSLLPADKSGPGSKEEQCLPQILLCPNAPQDFWGKNSNMYKLQGTLCMYFFSPPHSAPSQTCSALSSIPELNEVCEVNALTSPWWSTSAKNSLYCEVKTFAQRVKGWINHSTEPVPQFPAGENATRSSTI